MNIENLSGQDQTAPEKTAQAFQKEVQKEAIKEVMTGDNAQQQVLQLIATVQPIQQVQETAKNQISKGFLDIKI